MSLSVTTPRLREMSKGGREESLFHKILSRGKIRENQLFGGRTVF
jgi:hypothetical protein